MTSSTGESATRRNDGAWARPTSTASYCLIDVIVAGAVVTACRGRFKLDEGIEFPANPRNPPAALRCGGCTRARLERSLRELRDAFVELSERCLQALDAAQSATSALIELWIAETCVGTSAITSAFPDEADWLDADGSTR